jgi:hypothetical protein
MLKSSDLSPDKGGETATPGPASPSRDPEFSIRPVVDTDSKTTEDGDQQTYAAIPSNNIRGILKVCGVKAPGFGDRRKPCSRHIRRRWRARPLQNAASVAGPLLTTEAMVTEAGLDPERGAAPRRIRLSVLAVVGYVKGCLCRAESHDKNDHRSCGEQHVCRQLIRRRFTTDRQ